VRLWRSEQPRRPIAHLARELGIHPEVLRTPIRRDQADHGERTDLPTTAEREELQRLRKRVVELERANEILKAASAWFAGELDPTTVMSFVDAHRDLFGVEPILRVLDIPVSTFYGWGAQQRDPCRRRRDDQALTNRIRRIHHRSGQTYGAPRIHAQLRRDGVQVSRKRVARLLGAHGLRGAFLRKRWRWATRQDPTATPAPDLVRRDFTAEAPNRGWVADLSRIPTGEGPLWLASVRDACSRRIVGWKTSDRADTELVVGALEDAIWGRGLDDDPGQRRLIHHSDRGSQLGFKGSSQHRLLLTGSTVARRGPRRGFSSRGSCGVGC
jgi:transposase InsO family protein